MNEQFFIQQKVEEFSNVVSKSLPEEYETIFSEALEMPYIYFLSQYKKHNKLHIFINEVRLYQTFFSNTKISNEHFNLIEQINNILIEHFEIKPCSLNELSSFVNSFKDSYSGMPFYEFVPIAIKNGFTNILHSFNGHTVWTNNKNVLLLSTNVGDSLTECNIIFPKIDGCLPLFYNSENTVSFSSNNLFNYRFHRIHTCNNIFHSLQLSERYIDCSSSELNILDIWQKLSQEEIKSLFNQPTFVNLFFDKIDDIYSKHF